MTCEKGNCSTWRTWSLGIARSWPSWIAASLCRSARERRRSADTRPKGSVTRNSAVARNWLLRLSDTEQRLAEGRLSIVLGGAGTGYASRHNLHVRRSHLGAVAAINGTLRRMFISADGETGKPFGNETIRVAPHGNDEYTVTIRLPSPFAHLSNTPGRTPTYRMANPVQWHHLSGEWNSTGQRRPGGRVPHPL